MEPQAAQVPKVVLMAAVDEDGGLGLRGGLAWRLPDDLRRLRLMTLGHVIIMGRTTAQGLGRLLPGRASVILSRTSYEPHPPQDDDTPRAQVAQGVEGALTLAGLYIAQGWPREVFVLGGGEVYAAMAPLASRIELTRVPGRWGCDVRAPWLDVERSGAALGAFGVGGMWREVRREQGPALDVQGLARCAEYIAWERG